jgi:hypothetical protein
MPSSAAEALPALLQRQCWRKAGRGSRCSSDRTRRDRLHTLPIGFVSLLTTDLSFQPRDGSHAQPCCRRVRLDDGNIVSTTNVVLAVAPEVASRLVPEAPHRVAAASSGVAAKAACLDLGLARLQKPANTVAFGVDRPLYYSVHSATADLAPAHGATIHVAKYLDPSTGGNARVDRQELEGFLNVMQLG